MFTKFCLIFIQILLLSHHTLLRVSTTELIEKEEKKLKISLYYETLCPDCIKFDREQLYPVYKKIPEYIQLDLVPYGNAQRTESPAGKYHFRCQHGVQECRGNKLHACAISILPPNLSSSFIGCSMSQERPPEAGPFCANLLNMTEKFEEIKTCAHSAEGSRLLNENGIRTDALIPQHTFVPWVIFDGVYNEHDLNDSLDDLMAVVCRRLKGPTLPNACNEVF